MMIPSSSAFVFEKGKVNLSLTPEGRRAVISARVMCGNDDAEIRKSLGWSPKDWKEAMQLCEEFKNIVERDPIDSLRGETVAAIMELLRDREPGTVKMCAQALIPEMGDGASVKAPSVLDDIVKAMSKAKPLNEKGGHVDDNPHN